MKNMISLRSINDGTSSDVYFVASCYIASLVLATYAFSGTFLQRNRNGGKQYLM